MKRGCLWGLGVLVVVSTAPLWLPVLAWALLVVYAALVVLLRHI